MPAGAGAASWWTRGMLLGAALVEHANSVDVSGSTHVGAASWWTREERSCVRVCGGVGSGDNCSRSYGPDVHTLFEKLG